MTWKPPGYKSIAATPDEARFGRVCECPACTRDGQHEPMCNVHEHDWAEPQICNCPVGDEVTAVIGQAPAEWVHVLSGGYALCRFPGVPRDWPKGHRWVSLEEKGDATCPHCLRQMKEESTPLTVVDTPDLRRAIARAVLDDLEDRRGVTHELAEIRSTYPETYAEIEEAIAANVMRVLAAAKETTR